MKIVGSTLQQQNDTFYKALGDGILLLYVFSCETIEHTKEAIFIIEQQLAKDKLTLENCDMITMYDLA